MTALNIQQALINRLTDILKDFPMKLSYNDHTPFKIFRHKLPEQLLDLFDYDEKDTHKDVYPFCVVKIDDGEKKTREDMGTTTLRVGIGVKNEDLEGKGYDDIVICITKILEDLNTNPILEKMYLLEYPINWKVDDGGENNEDHPFYHGVIALNFSSKSMQYLGGNKHGEFGNTKSY